MASKGGQPGSASCQRCRVSGTRLGGAAYFCNRFGSLGTLSTRRSLMRNAQPRADHDRRKVTARYRCRRSCPFRGRWRTRSPPTIHLRPAYILEFELGRHSLPMSLPTHRGS
jgi:hypothetical protein